MREMQLRAHAVDHQQHGHAHQHKEPLSHAAPRPSPLLWRRSGLHPGVALAKPFTEKPHSTGWAREKGLEGRMVHITVVYT
jgi:hypothetical protein